MSRPKLSIFDHLTFGKHQGELLGSVIGEDPKYVRWMLSEGWLLDEQATAYLEECD